MPWGDYISIPPQRGPLVVNEAELTGRTRLTGQWDLFTHHFIPKGESVFTKGFVGLVHVLITSPGLGLVLGPGFVGRVLVLHIV